MKYTIYMLKDEHYDKLFMNHDWTLAHGGVDLDEYEPVYSDTIYSFGTTSAMLEFLFTLFNHRHPEDYHGRSMSVSDVIVFGDGTAWFCDSVGFIKVHAKQNGLHVCTECKQPIEDELDMRIVNERLGGDRVVCAHCLADLESDGTLTRCEECGEVFSPMYLEVNPETNDIELCPYCGKVFCP